MRYFTYIAEQAFKTSSTGERLFYRYVPWSRPYIIPDAATEQRLYRKQVWVSRVLLGGMIIGQPFLFMLHPDVILESSWFLIYLISVIAVFWTIDRLVFARELSGLQRTPAPLRLRSFYGQLAERHSPTGLAVRLIGSILFSICGIWMLSVGLNVAGGIFCAVFFGLCAVGWGYAFYLKGEHEGPPSESDEHR